MIKSKRHLTFVGAFVVIGLLIGAMYWKTEKTAGITNTEELRQNVRNALAEINLPKINNSAAINTASGNLANFIQYRSGVQLSQTNKNLLQINEQNAWNQSKRLSKNQLIDILTEIASDKLRNLSDADLSSATETLRGFNAADLPQSFQKGRDYVSLRASGAGSMTVQEFNAQVGFIRGSNVDSKMSQTLINNSITLEVEDKINILRDAEPDFFGATKSDMTPMQAVLISYGVITDDIFSGNQTQLTQQMQSIYQGISQANGQDYADPRGHSAFGKNGYIFSSPADLLMDDSSVNSLIMKIQQRSGL